MIPFVRSERSPLIWVALLLWVGCRAPVRPVDGPHSPASPAAGEGAAAVVTRAIEEEPPLPGEDVSGWKGLGAAELDLGERVHEHQHHHGEDGEHGHDHEHDHEHGSEPHEEPHGHGSRATSAEERDVVD